MPTTTPPAPGSRIETPSEPIELQGSFRQRLQKAHADRLLVDVLALATLMTAVLNLVWWPAAAAVTMLVLLVLAAPRLPLRRRSLFPTGSFTVGRILLTAAVGLALLSSSDWFGWLALAAIMFLVIAETTYRRVISGAVPFSSHLPGIDVRNDALFPSALIFYINLLCLLVSWLLLAVDLPFLCYIPIATALLVMATGTVDAILRIRRRRYASAKVRSALQKYAPKFVLYWEAPAKAAFQIGMWLPYLEQLNLPFIIITRSKGSFYQARSVTSQPVLVAYRMRDLEDLLVPSITTAFYVNNSTVNTHMARYHELTHVQLLHGDSDKAPSFNPMNRMYDKNFVAGTAAIDRYRKRGISVREDFFEIVGRPQVADIEVTNNTSQLDKHPYVLYAPTWAGYHKDAAYSSLINGQRIVTALLDHGCHVIFRPHPYTHRSRTLLAEAERVQHLLQVSCSQDGLQHIYGPAAEEAMTVKDCFNKADAMIADISSVVPDFLYSEKPYAISAMQTNPEDFETINPIAQGGYLIRDDASNVETILENLLGEDPKRAQRRKLKTYYLGDFPHETYTEAFVEAARRVVTEQ